MSSLDSLADCSEGNLQLSACHRRHACARPRGSSGWKRRRRCRCAARKSGVSAGAGVPVAQLRYNLLVPRQGALCQPVSPAALARPQESYPLVHHPGDRRWARTAGPRDPGGRPVRGRAERPGRCRWSSWWPPGGTGSTLSYTASGCRRRWAIRSRAAGQRDGVGLGDLREHESGDGADRHAAHGTGGARGGWLRHTGGQSLPQRHQYTKVPGAAHSASQICGHCVYRVFWAGGV